MAKKFVILTAALLASSKIEDIKAAIETNPQGAANDLIILLEQNKALAIDLAEANKEKETFEALAKSHEATIEELSKKLDEKPNPTATGYEGASFTHKDVAYGFNFPRMKFEGNAISYEDVVKDEALQAKLISKMSGMIYQKS